MDAASYAHLVRSFLSSRQISLPAGPDPRTYLEFAVADLNEADSERLRVNAVSNAKRALHFQVDLIADAFGFGALGPRTNASFPNKLDFCIRCGVVGPQILRKLNRLRNAVEHEYYIPTRDEAEDFIDVVELFLSATDRLLEDFPIELSLESGDDLPEELTVRTHYLTIRLEPGTGTIIIELKRLTISIDELHRIAGEERMALEAEVAERKRQSGIGTVFVGGIEAAAYARAAQSKYEVSTVTLSVSQGDAYFSWVAFLNEKSK